MRYLTTWLLLAGFWLLLSGHYTPLILAFGLVSVSLVTFFLWRVDQQIEPTPVLRLTVGLVRYIPWLMLELAKANIAVAKRVLNPKLPIDPRWEPLQTNLQTPLQRTLYINSITVTPDTFVTHIEDNGDLMIHALWPESIAGLRSGDMERRVRATEI